MYILEVTKIAHSWVPLQGPRLGNVNYVLLSTFAYYYCP